jgi:hypothetical protein
MAASEANQAQLIRKPGARPEDVELSKKKAELAELQSRLADLEFQLLNLRVELNEFESLYFTAVGALYAELDEIEALIAERVAKQQPSDSNAQAAQEARRRAKESAQVAKDIRTTPKLLRSDSLRDLYRVVAKRIHPDLADNDQDRALRERLMTEVNLAYARGDEAKVRVILEEYEDSPDAVAGNHVGAELVRTIRRINLVTNRIQTIEFEVTALKTCELYRLKEKLDEGSRKGKNILAELADSLRQQIKTRRDHLRSMRFDVR